MHTLINQLLSWRHPLLILTLVVAGFTAMGIQYASVDNTFRAILAEDDPFREEVEKVREDFPPSTAVLFAFMARDGDLFNFEALRAMDELTNRYSEVNSAVSIASLSNRRLNAVDANEQNRDYLLPELSQIGEEDLPGIREVALNDEDLVKSLLSPGGDLALALLKYKASTDDKETRLAIAESVIELRDSLRENYPGVDIYVLGNVLFEWDSYQAQIKDSQFLFPLVITISILLLWFCLKSLLYGMCIFAIAFVTIALNVGTAGWIEMSFNQISTMGPLVVIMIATAHGVHIVSIYAQALHRGLEKVEAMRHSLEVNLQPVSLATFTTTIGFLGLNYCSSPGIYGFGNVVAIGVVWAYVVTLTMLPALILWLPTNKVPRPLGVHGFVRWVIGLVERRSPQLFWSSVFIILATFALLPLNTVDFNRFSFVDKDSDFHHVMTALSEKIGNDQSLVYAVDAGEYYGITEPGFLEQVDEFTQWLEAQPEASFVSSFTDYLKVRNEAEHDNDEAYYVLPTDHLQIIDYLVGYQLIQEIEPNLEPLFNTEYSSIRMVVGTSNLSNKELLSFSNRIDAWVKANVKPEYQVLHGDNSILFARLDRSISVELMEGFAFSFVLITLTMMIGLKSVRYGLLSIMPNVFPATIVFGFWGIYNGQLSPYILMLFSISIGLVVDDSVHVLSKYITARREGKPPEQAVEFSLDKAGPAITITTLSLAMSTIILVFSNTFYYENVALMLTPIIVVAWLLDLLFLPPMLVRFDNWWEGRRSPGAAATLSN